MQVVQTLLKVNGLSVTTHPPLQITEALRKASYSEDEIEEILHILYNGQVPSALEHLLYASGPQPEKPLLSYVLPPLVSLWRKGFDPVQAFLKKFGFHIGKE